MTTQDPDHDGRRSGRNWFDSGGESYARFRPGYPRSLAGSLADLAPDDDVAVDVGCGTGKFTSQLVGHFGTVIGADPSQDQLANAADRDLVHYVCAPAERIPVADHSVSLVTAAQAAHWFDLSAFYPEVRRIGKPRAAVALISYGVPGLDGEVGERFRHFYRHDTGPFWPPERRLVDEGYRTLDFPFEELPFEAPSIRKSLTLKDFLGYLATWSAIRRAREAGREQLLADFARDLATIWPDPGVPRTVTWPVNARVGRL